MIGSQRALASETVSISFLALDANGAAITAASDFTIAITRTSDGARLDFSDSTFGGTITTGTATLVEQDATNHPGLYSYDLDLSAITNHATTTDYFQVSVGETGSDLLMKPIGEIVVNPPDLLAAAYQNAIWIDGNNGTNGSQLGIHGTKETPTTTIANADTLATALGYKHYIIRGGSLTLNATTYTDYVFEGSGFPGTITLNSKTPIRCRFINVTVTGASGTAANASWVAEDCTFTAVTNIPTSDYRRCIMDGTCGVAANTVGAVDLLDCMDGASASGSFSLSLSGADTVSLRVSNYTGNITVTASGDASNDVEIHGIGAQITLTSNTAGAIDISGVNAVSDDAGGATVTTSGNIEPQDVQIITGLMMGNYVFDNETYSAAGLMTAARLRVFNSAANTPSTRGGSETDGLLATIAITATANATFPSLPTFVRGAMTKVTT